jgi:hypothetical protein
MPKESEIIFYKGDDGNVKIEVFYHNETFWMTQKKIAELFGVQRPAITKHLKNIFEEGELEEDSVSSILEHTAEDGKKYNTTFYNLDTIIAVGYRVNSNKARKFRIWATKVLKEFITKGFVLDDERLKQGKHFGKIILMSYLKGFVKFEQETAAEIIYTSADAKKLYMGLTNWKHAPDGKIVLPDDLDIENFDNYKY